MRDKLADMRNISFLLYEALKVGELTRFPYFEDHSKETFDMAIDTAYKLARDVFWPAYQECDREGVQFDGETVTVPKALHEILRQCREGGWFAPEVSYDYGGQQFPLVVFATAMFLFSAANTSAAMYVGGANGAARLLEEVASGELKELYMPKLLAGEWLGTMALTEPDAGTSLGDITASAVESPDAGHYLIRGVKRFISSGDHDLTPNIIHPVLARIEGAPPGVKGISLFVVPKYRLDADGNPDEFNDVITAGVEHKMGLKASATVTLNFGDNDDCHGWLIGEANSGLKHMFQLMNEARVFTGIQAVSQASAAYQVALEYTKERVQGRDIANQDPTTPQIPIINYADVRRMLLEQKAFVEGCLGLVLYCARQADIMNATEDEEERERLNLILEVLTPCCKAHGSDGAFQSITTALQCLGGVGFTEDFPVAQMLRDNKVFSIYEGANGIQALDLLGRKIPMKNGAAMKAFMKEVGRTLKEAAGIEALKDITEKVQGLQNELIATTMHLAGVGMSGKVHLYVANASAYLGVFSRMALSWQLLAQAMVAQKALDAGTDETDFYTGKVETARFYANTVIPHALAATQILKSNESTALDFKEEWF